MYTGGKSADNIAPCQGVKQTGIVYTATVFHPYRKIQTFLLVNSLTPETDTGLLLVRWKEKFVRKIRQTLVQAVRICKQENFTNSLQLLQ